MLLTLGVVYGDIGTSLLYAVKEMFSASHGIPLDDATGARFADALIRRAPLRHYLRAQRTKPDTSNPHVVARFGDIASGRPWLGGGPQLWKLRPAQE